MRKLIRVIGPAVAVGLFAGLLWRAIDSLAADGGVGMLARCGWPLGSPWTFVVLGAVAGVVGDRLWEARWRAVERDLADLGRRMGLAYSPSAEGLWEDHPGLDRMPLFRRRSGGTGRMSGRVAGRPVELFDYTEVHPDRRGQDRVTRRTVVVLPGVGLPDFDLRPRTLGARMLGLVGVRGISFDPAGVGDPDDAAAVAAFGRRYLVAAPDLGTYTARSLAPADPATLEGEEQAVRRLFAPELMRALACHPGWSAQAHGGYLAFWRGGIPIADHGPTLGAGSGSSGVTIGMGMWGRSRFCPPRKRTGLLEEALALHDALSRAASGQVAGPVVPAAPGTSRARHGDRLAGAVVGASVGMLCGIVIAAIGTMAVIFSRAARPLGGSASIAASLVFFGGIVLGTASGAALGALLRPDFPRRVGRRRVGLDPDRWKPVAKTSRRSQRLAGGMIALFGLFCVVFGIVLGARTVGMSYGSQAVTGQVVDLETPEAAGRRFGGALPVVEYRVGAGTYRIRGVTVSSDHRRGQPVAVLYKTDHPDVGQIDSFQERWKAPLTAIVLGAVASLVGLALLLPEGQGSPGS